ncbi:MAG: adenosylmethionine--8-amino-7-oxononanoate transaminase [Candidatus Omnitrophota bacterium]
MNTWIEKDLKYVWHPYTQMKDCKKLPPILIERAKGIKLYDNKGNFYYDTISSWWCNVHGHNHPKVKAAIKRQLDLFEHVMFAGFTHKPAIMLAEELIRISPESLTKVFFSDNGSTAVETALKMSFQYWHNTGKSKKTKFLSLDYGYHGDTIATMSVSSVDLFNIKYKALMFNSYKASSPYCYRCPVGKNRNNCSIECIGSLETALKNHNSEIAAVILEPLVMAAGGMIIYPKEYLEKAGALAEKYNVHLILDEVATGFGRTGKMFACDYTDIQPDFMCLSKGITAGFLAMGATLTTDKIYNAFYADYQKKKTFYHGHTYTANPLCCAAALASLGVFRKECTLDKIDKLIPVFHKKLEGFKNLPAVGDIRYIGMIGALELVKDKNTKEAFGFKERIGQKIYAEGLKSGILLRPLGNIIYFFLPLCIAEREIKLILEKSYNILSRISKSI